ncbi:hypothetical protein Mapa_007378 [Marchantia paleacea]|nr:hypothetical protein Mapa_007378 [Marchantia paleacea]
MRSCVYRAEASRHFTHRREHASGGKRRTLFDQCLMCQLWIIDDDDRPLSNPKSERLPVLGLQFLCCLQKAGSMTPYLQQTPNQRPWFWSRR